MKAQAKFEVLAGTVTSNGRQVKRAMVELSSTTGKWLGSFTAFGFNRDDLKDKAYTEAYANAKAKGYQLDSLREA